MVEPTMHPCERDAVVILHPRRTHGQESSHLDSVFDGTIRVTSGVAEDVDVGNAVIQTVALWPVLDLRLSTEVSYGV